MPYSMNNGARPLRRSPTAFRHYDDDSNIQDSMVGFLEDVWGRHKQDCFGFVAFSRPDGSQWREIAIDMAEPEQDLKTFFSRRSRWNYNLFFCPNSFSEPSRKKQFALSTSWAWCDMDASRWRDYTPFPSLCWETSPRRFQAIWHWDKRNDPKEAEDYSRALAYRHGGDRNGWSITKMLRLPGSINHKPKYDEPIIKLIHSNWRPIVERPRPFQHSLGENTGAHMSVRPDLHDPLEVLEKHRRRLKRDVIRLVEDERVIGRDRSACIFKIIAAFHAADATPDEIAAVLWRNVYFLSKHGKNLSRLDAEISRVISKLEGQV